jgi:hypothetical protein
VLKSSESTMASTNDEDSKQPTEERPAASELHDTETPILHSTETNDSPSPSAADEPRLTESWRQVVGTAMDSVSDAINDNIVAARYATFASVALLSAYGLANTPLFFRFKTVSEIPGTLRFGNIRHRAQEECDSSFFIVLIQLYSTASYFLRRRKIHGRLIRVVDYGPSAKGAMVWSCLLSWRTILTF